MSRIPEALQTERLHLRCWRGDDAHLLLPILEVNADHLLAWIPPQVGTPAPLPDLILRLHGFAAAFHADREWRYAIFSADDHALLGEASLFARSAEGRVPLAEADRLEIGYWLRADATGRGYATEAARALLELSNSIPEVTRVEIRCDARNRPSAAVPERLGFRLTSPTEASAGEESGPASRAMIWQFDLPPDAGPPYSPAR